MSLASLTALAVFAACFPLYHLIYLHISSNFSRKTKKGRIHSCTRSWLGKIIEEDQYLLATHQIRNMIMGITFLASTVVLLIGLIVKLDGVPLELNVPVQNEIAYASWLIVLTLGYSFVNLLLALRHLTNLTTLIGSEPEGLSRIEDSEPIEYLSKLFNKGSQRYMMGRRGLLYAIVILGWYFNVWVFLGLTLLLTVSLAYQHDF